MVGNFFVTKDFQVASKTDRFPRQAAETQLNLGKPEAASILVKARTNGTSAWMIFNWFFVSTWWTWFFKFKLSESEVLFPCHFHAMSIPFPCHFYPLVAMQEAERVVAREGGAQELQEKAQRSGIHVSSFSDENCCVFHGNVGCRYISWIFNPQKNPLHDQDPQRTPNPPRSSFGGMIFMGYDFGYHGNGLFDGPQKRDAKSGPIWCLMTASHPWCICLPRQILWLCVQMCM